MTFLEFLLSPIRPKKPRQPVYDSWGCLSSKHRHPYIPAGDYIGGCKCGLLEQDKIHVLALGDRIDVLSGKPLENEDVPF
jgi:hypothetical protein